ncbi:hypothetical protein PIB30_031410 [Stylosanthes scabra]|uniref:Uncharacterized protein n=1 Tax=Stylosanthes scabra TaxID=79078 RepID=A0ABU6Z8Q2_9FABA|nr:hypothetical protein [Stylosanthes scabra]
MKKSPLSPPSLLKHASGNSRGKGMMGRLQKSRKPHPTKKIITILRHVNKEKRNAPSQRLDHKKTRSSRNSEERNSPHTRQVTGSRQNHPEKDRKMGRKLASLAQKPQAPEWGQCYGPTSKAQIIKE